MIPNPYVLGGAAIALIVALGAGWLLGYDTGLQKHYEFKAQVEVQQNELREEIEKQRLVSDGIVKDVSDAWQRALDYRGEHLVVRVLPGASCDTRESTTLPVTGLKPDAETKEPRLGREVAVAVERCEQRLNWAAQDAAQVMKLQEFITRQHEASK